jgi:uncharacterized membrane protein YphA (DoxX/SURF4 family)
MVCRSRIIPFDALVRDTKREGITTMTQATATRPASTSTTASSGTARRQRAANVALWALQVVTAAVFVFAALPKILADPQAVAGFEAIGFGVVGMYIIGALELAGAVALLIPRLSGLAGLCFVGLMVGAVITTLLTGGASMVVLPAVVLVLAAVIAWGRRGRTAELVTWVRGSVHR